MTVAARVVTWLLWACVAALLWLAEHMPPPKPCPACHQPTAVCACWGTGGCMDDGPRSLR